MRKGCTFVAFHPGLRLGQLGLISMLNSVISPQCPLGVYYATPLDEVTPAF